MYSQRSDIRAGIMPAFVFLPFTGRVDLAVLTVLPYRASRSSVSIPENNPL